MSKITLNKRYFFIIPLLFIYAFVKAQSVDSTSTYIDSLSWKSFGFTTNYIPKLYLSETAKKIISIQDKNKVQKLFNYIIVKNKAVIVHIILTKLLNPDKDTFSESYVYNGDSIIGIKYTYNGLSWKWDRKNGFSILEKNIKKIRDFWRTKLAYN